MTTNRGSLLLSALGLVALVPMATASTTVGPDLPAPSTSNICGPGVDCTYIGGTPAAPGNRVSENGVITTWRMQSGSAGSVVTLRVLRPASGGLRVIASSAPLTTSGSITDAPVRLPVRAGDVLGVSNASSALIFGPAPGNTTVFTGPVAPGQLLTTPTPMGGQTGVTPLLQAVVEPDADTDGFGDETQDQCRGDRTRQTAPCRPAFSLTRLALPTARTLRQARTVVIATTTPSRSAVLHTTVTALRPGRRVGTVCAPREIQMMGPACSAPVVVRRGLRTVPGRRVGVPVNLRGLPVGRYLVRVEATDREGSNITRVRQAIVTLRR